MLIARKKSCFILSNQSSSIKILGTKQLILKALFFFPDTRMSIIPETQLGNVPLVFPSRGYRQLAKDEILHMLLPQGAVYPNSKIYVPVFLEQPRTSERGPISALTIK